MTFAAIRPSDTVTVTLAQAAANEKRLTDSRPAFVTQLRKAEQRETEITGFWDNLPMPPEVEAELARVREDKTAAKANLKYRDDLILQAKKTLTETKVREELRQLELQTEEVRFWVAQLIPAVQKYDTAARKLGEAHEEIRRAMHALAPYKAVHGYSRHSDLNPEHSFKSAMLDAGGSEFCRVHGIDALHGTANTLLNAICSRFAAWLPLPALPEQSK